MKLFTSFFFGGRGGGGVNLTTLKLISCRLEFAFVSLQVGDAEATAKA